MVMAAVAKEEAKVRNGGRLLRYARNDEKGIARNDVAAGEYEDEVPNTETIQAMREAYAQIASGERGTMDIDEFFAEIEANA